jgi:hypothetical protein
MMVTSSSLMTKHEKTKKKTAKHNRSKGKTLYPVLYCAEFPMTFTYALFGRLFTGTCVRLNVRWVKLGVSDGRQAR